MPDLMLVFITKDRWRAKAGSAALILLELISSVPVALVVSRDSYAFIGITPFAHSFILVFDFCSNLICFVTRRESNNYEFSIWKFCFCLSKG